MKLVFDIETDGLDPSKIHCIVAKDVDTKEVYDFGPDSISEGVHLLAKAKVLIGHNIMGYDIPVIKKLYPFFKTYRSPAYVDTLVLSRLIWPDRKEKDFKLFREGKLEAPLIGRHSLESWGQRLGDKKGAFSKTTDWQEFSLEMLKYCIQDVELNYRFYLVCMNEKFSMSAILLEHKIHQICLQQTEHGFPLDEKKAVELYTKLSGRRQEIYDELVERFGQWWEAKGLVTPKRTLNYKSVERASVWANAPYTKIERVTFNPASRFHIAQRLTDKYGWEPEVFTETDEPKVDDKVLGSLEYPEAKLLSEYLLINKRIGQLAEGKQAWLKLSKDGKIHGRVTTMGAVTSRCTHQGPNTGQIPSVGAKYGTECRSLFYAPKGWKLMGCDVSGLELRVLAHYCHPWDEGKYGEILLNGDIHQVNADAIGLSRSAAKTFQYALLYGGGDEKIGSIVGGGKSEGRALKKKFFKATPAIEELRKAVQAKAKEGFIKGIDGRRVPIRHSHAALNTLLQSCGAILCKRWVVIFHEILKENGFVEGRDYKQVAFVHDEIQVLVKEELADDIGQLCIKAIELSGQYYKFRLPLTGEYKCGQNWAETH